MIIVLHRRAFLTNQLELLHELPLLHLYLLHRVHLFNFLLLLLPRIPASTIHLRINAVLMMVLTLLSERVTSCELPGEVIDVIAFLWLIVVRSLSRGCVMI